VVALGSLTPRRTNRRSQGAGGQQQSPVIQEQPRGMPRHPHIAESGQGRARRHDHCRHARRGSRRLSASVRTRTCPTSSARPPRSGNECRAFCRARASDRVVQPSQTSLENRFGPLGPTRVQIPPPPLVTGEPIVPPCPLGQAPWSAQASAAPCSASQAFATRFCARVSQASTTSSSSSSRSSRARSRILTSTAG
jgi:hypothetical protein